MDAQEVRLLLNFLLPLLLLLLSHSSGSPVVFSVKAEPATETPIGWRTRSTGIVINEGGRRASSSAPTHFVNPKTEPRLAAVKPELGLPP